MAIVLIAGGSGMIGKRLTSLLQSRGDEVRWLSRKQEKNAGVKTYYWNPQKKEIDAACLEDCDAIVNLAGTAIAGKRWSAAYKKDIIDSRVDAAATLLSALKNNKHNVKVLVAASAVGYYGDRKEALMTENDHAGEGFLSVSTSVWEAAYNASQVRTVLLRTGVVLSTEGGALKEISAPLKFGVCPILGTGKQYMSWIHLDDICRIFMHAIDKEEMSGIYNAVADEPSSHHDFMQTLKAVIAPRSLTVSVPELLLRIVIGEKSAVVLESTRVSNKKIRAAGFQFQYTALKQALKNIYAQ